MADGTSIGVVVATFGDLDTWGPLAERAVRAAGGQAPVVWRHDETLAAARNAAAAEMDASWLVFCDADDELDDGYIEAMRRVVYDREMREQRLLDLLVQPSTIGVVDGRVDERAVLIEPRRSLLDGNHMVIGTMVRRAQFERVGGFRDLDAYEDWDLWIRCVLDGAAMTSAPDAVYRVHVRAGSRNDLTRQQAVQVYQSIRGRYEAQWRDQRITAR